MDKSIIFMNGNSNFTSLSEFRQSLDWGAEIQFVWKGVTYGVIRYGTDGKITIYEAEKPETEKVCETPDDALDFRLVSGERLRDVLTQVEVVERTI